MDFEHLFLVAFMFALAFPFNQLVIMFFLMASGIHDLGGRAIGYFGVFCYALIVFMYDVLLFWMLITHAKTYVPS